MYIYACVCVCNYMFTHMYIYTRLWIHDKTDQQKENFLIFFILQFLQLELINCNMNMK